jgi:hypothetical protein
VILYYHQRKTIIIEREVMIMYTRCFERGNETINISEYGFELYVDDKVVKTGLVDGLDETVEMLIQEGFEEVL